LYGHEELPGKVESQYSKRKYKETYREACKRKWSCRDNVV